MSKLIRLADFRRQKRNIYFNRRELNRLLSLYSRHVARGEWRDYAIDHGPGMAVFSVFRHSQDRPLFAVAKCADGLDRGPQFLVLNGQHKLKSGASIDEVLDVLDAPLRVVS
jgi:hypothetical protein